MLFMNEWDIENALDRHRLHPALGPATRFLSDFRIEANQHSDGWHSWPLPARAAKQLMTLIQRGNAHQRDFRVPDVTMAEVQKALIPIKSFMTRRGLKAGMRMPALQFTIPV